MEKISRYKGKKIDVVYDRSLCIHVAECGRGSKALFDASKDPWCDPDAVAVEQAVDIIERCPTGALTYERSDGAAQEQAATHNEITVAQDGPLYLRGNLSIQNANGKTSMTRAALCRCGESSNKPYCDRSHAKKNFQDNGAVGPKGEAMSEAGGCLEIQPAPDGPLLLAGNFQLRGATGRLAFSGRKAALCRCGASNNKPFCDGSHTAIGFKSS